MKALTFAGPGVLVIPGIATLTAGDTEIVHDGVAAAVKRGCPDLKITIEDAPQSDHAPVTVDASQPEAHQGEGQPTATQEEEE